MATRPEPLISWKTEAAALLGGLLIGACWQMVHYGILPLLRPA